MHGSPLVTNIYGQYMRSGAMFASLAGYKDQAYYEEHPTLMLMTPDENYTVALFAGYVASVDDPAWEVVFSDALPAAMNLAMPGMSYWGF